MYSKLNASWTLLDAFSAQSPKSGRLVQMYCPSVVNNYGSASKRFAYSFFAATLMHVFIFAILRCASPTMTSHSDQWSRALSHQDNVMMSVMLASTSAAQKNVPLRSAVIALPSLAASTTLAQSTSAVSIDTPPVRAKADEDTAWQAEYQRTSNLQKSPQPLADITPIYPKQAGKMRGKVGLRLFINEFGHVDKVVVTHAMPVGIFEASAIEAFQQAKFSPGTALGIPVKSQLAIEVLFSPFTQE